MANIPKISGTDFAGLYPRVSQMTQKQYVQREQKARQEGLPLDMRNWPWRLTQAEVGSELVATCQRWLVHRDVNMLLLGPSGCAKGAAVMRLLAKIRKEGVHHGGEKYSYVKRMAFAKAADLCEFKSGDKFSREVEPEIRRFARTATLLVIDDLGKEPVSHGLFEVLDHRYDVANRPRKQSAPTVITSELGVDALKAKYDNGTMRRLMTHGGRDSLVVDLTTEG